MSQKKKQSRPMAQQMLMTAKEMSKVSGIGENTLRRLMDEGELEYLQIGSHRLLCQDAIWDYYERHKVRIRASKQFVGNVVAPSSFLRCVNVNIC